MPSPATDNSQRLTGDKLPNWVVLVVLAICAAPAVLILLVIDISTSHAGLDYGLLQHLPKAEATDTVFHALLGAFFHVLLEWSAVGAAAITFVLCLANWSVNRNSLLPIIGIALLSAGALDAFHTLTATRMIEASADNNQLIPFTWAIARTFDLLITTVGIAICLKGKVRKQPNKKKIVWRSAIVFLGLAYRTIHICATSPNLPQTQFPDALLTRP
ncbi:MAG: hypothetical protein GY930_13815 [bacterium]|nr:hypothetical protein [bacterium]